MGGLRGRAARAIVGQVRQVGGRAAPAIVGQVRVRAARAIVGQVGQVRRVGGLRRLVGRLFFWGLVGN